MSQLSDFIKTGKIDGVKGVRFKLQTWQMVFVGIASAFVVIILNSLSFGLNAHRVIDSVAHTFFIASMVSIVILYFAPSIYEYPIVKRLLILIPAIFIATIIGIFLTRLFLGIFYNDAFLGSGLIPGYRTTIFSSIISYVFGLSAYFYITSQNKLKTTEEQLRQKELDEAKAKSLAVSAQLASLESKIHPHFLFNTLNSIAALIKEDPDLAEKMVEKLSVLLRYSLDFEPSKLVNLHEELKITKDYLEIESTRFADRLDYNFDIDENLIDKKLPAFSLQTLVENSIKHVASKRSGKTTIGISAKRINENLIIEVKDNGDGFSESDLIKGHGLDTLQKRIANIFAGDAKLEVLEGGVVQLKIRV